VAALATRAGLDVGEPVSGAELDDLDDAALDRLVARSNVFGRVPPSRRNGSSRRCVVRAATSQ
jgi:cation-transporting P-type ATPase E